MKQFWRDLSGILWNAAVILGIYCLFSGSLIIWWIAVGTVLLGFMIRMASESYYEVYG